jgi:hypothetical protein
VAAPALAMALVIFSALNLTNRPSLFLIFKFIKNTPSVKRNLNINTSKKRYILGYGEILPLHIVIFKEILNFFLGGYSVRNSPLKPLGDRDSTIVIYNLLYSEKIMEKTARP